jgi:hypothetical protein
MFSLSFSEDFTVHVAFYSCNIYYTDTLKISEEILINLLKSTTALYVHPSCQCNSNSRKLPVELKPEILLKNLSVCGSAHETIIKAHSNVAVSQHIPLFLEMLTSKFNEELARLNIIAQDVSEKTNNYLKI